MESSRDPRDDVRRTVVAQFMLRFSRAYLLGFHLASGLLSSAAQESAPTSHDQAFKTFNHIGHGWQMVFDGRIVESIEHTRLRLNPAVKCASNPIIKSDRPWEDSDLRIAWVIFDHALKKFRMRYTVTSYRSSGRDRNGDVIIKRAERGSRVCEAFSPDGIHWEKPNLGLVSFNGSTDNNIVPPEMHYSYFFQDRHDPDPARRYKAHVRAVDPKDGGMTLSLFFSADAYHWVPYPRNPVIAKEAQTGRWGPTHFMGWDPIRACYAVHMESEFHVSGSSALRCIGRAESPDLIHWSEATTIVTPDSTDFPDTEFYAMPTTVYEGLYIGYLWLFSTTNTTHVPQFVFSYDGINYNRELRDPIIALGDNSRFDSVSIYAEAPIVHDGRIYCFYTGTNWRSPEQLLEQGGDARAGIGLATLGPDGFASFDGGRREFSSVTTRPITFGGRRLYLNSRAALQKWGADPPDVRVEILDARHRPIDGFRLSDADNSGRNGTTTPVTWKGRDDLSVLENHPVHLKIYFKNAKLYSFQLR